MDLVESIESYYQNENCFKKAKERLGDDFLQWSHIRIFDNRAFWNKVKRKINNWEELRQVILSYLEDGKIPCKIYYTPSKWLNPEDLGDRERKNGGYLVRDNYLLYQDLIVFDLDSLKEGHLLALLEFLKNMNEIDETLYTIFSGRRGYHVCAKRERLFRKVKDPIRKELEYKNENKKLADKILENLEIDLDKVALINPRHVFKIPLTLSVNQNFVGICKFLDNSNYKSWTPDSSFALRSRKKPECWKEDPKAKENKENGKGSNSSHRVGIRSSINGTNGAHVLFKNFHKDLDDLDEVKRQATRLIQEHNLSDMWILYDGSKLWGVCLKKLDYEKLEKIVNVPKSGNILWVTNDMKIVSRIDGFPSHHLSRPHSRYFGFEGGNVGKDELSICRAEVEK